METKPKEIAILAASKLDEYKRILGKIAILARNRLNEYKRVLKISDKPDREEFSMSAKVTGAGMVIIGGLGMMFYLVSNLLPGAV